MTMSRDRRVGNRPVLRVNDNTFDGSCGLWEMRKVERLVIVAFGDVSRNQSAE